MRRFLCALLLLVLPCLAFAQDPGPDRFPQFRTLSGLGCGGYGLDAQGRASLSGPVGFSVPTAYVLGHDQLRINGSLSLSARRPSVTFAQDNDTVAGTFGHTFGRVNVAFTDMVLSTHLDQAYNLQVELIPSGDARLAASVGCQDILGGGGSSGTDLPGDGRSSRSLFACGTARLGSGPRPLYASAGLGTRRFGRGFVSASWQALPPVRGWLEWDGFGVSVGVLLAAHQGAAGRPFEVNALVGLVDGKYLVCGGGIGF